MPTQSHARPLFAHQRDATIVGDAWMQVDGLIRDE
jgi:hypothetical protein